MTLQARCAIGKILSIRVPVGFEPSVFMGWIPVLMTNQQCLSREAEPLQTKQPLLLLLRYLSIQTIFPKITPGGHGVAIGLPRTFADRWCERLETVYVTQLAVLKHRRNIYEYYKFTIYFRQHIN